MAAATICAVRMAAAHDGEAELCVTLRFANGGLSQVALDEHAAGALLTACGATTADALIGTDWTRVRDALIAASNRFAEAI